MYGNSLGARAEFTRRPSSTRLRSCRIRPAIWDRQVLSAAPPRRVSDTGNIQIQAAETNPLALGD